MEALGKQRGITLIETAMASSIMAVALGAALPSFHDTLARRAVDGAATELAADLQHIRSEAVVRNAALRISFEHGAAGSCYVIHTGASGECSCSGAAVGSCSGTATEIKTVQFPAGGRVQLQSNAASMVFHPVRGTTTPAGTVRVLGPGSTEVRQIVSILGRTRSCSPQAAMPGYPAC
jgi:type IV fimbrial biogenesis protein FimT